MIITISDMIFQAQNESNPAFGVDTLKLSKKPLYNSEENDIHRLYRYVMEINPYEKLPLEKINNYNIGFELSKSHFNPTLRPFMHNYFIDFSWFDFENSSFPELRYFQEVLFHIMMYFNSTPCFQTSLLGYLCLLASEQLPYEETCFHNFFLIDHSESPVTTNAIRHFQLDIRKQNVRFIFKDYNMSLSDTFKVLIGKNDFIEFLKQKHSIIKIEKANNAIFSVLSNL